MALTPEEKTLLVAILLIVLTITLYVELRYFRGKKKEVRTVSQRKDEAFNAVMTTRAVVNALRRQGRDTQSAESMLRSARNALDRGDSNRCIELCEDARDELMRSRPAEVSVPDRDTEPIDVLAEKIISGRPTSQGAPTSDYRGTALPLDNEPNYLQAKFEMGAAKSEVKMAAKRGADVWAAEKTLEEAEKEFSAKNYSKALSLALKSRKDLGGDVARETITLKKERPAPSRGVKEASVVEEKAEGHAPCSECGEGVAPGDDFCSSCGAKVVVEKFCGGCGKMAKPKDKFCRKCGAGLD